MTTDPFLIQALAVVSDVTNVRLSDIAAKSRSKDLVIARQLFCWICVQHLKTSDKSGLSLTKIGKAINRDHSTVLYSAKKFKERCEIYESDRQLQREVKQRFRVKKAALHLEIEMKADEVSGVMLDFINDLVEGLTNIESHIHNDASMEGWRRAKVKYHLNNIKSVLSSYPGRQKVKNAAVKYLSEKLYETKKV